MAGSYDRETLAHALPLITGPNPRLLGCGTYYLAELDGEPVGCGGWSREAPGSVAAEPGIGHVRHFAAAGQHSRKGIGRAIFGRCEADARTAGIGTLICYASLNAEPFYASLGFRRVGLIHVAIGKQVTFPSVHMELSL
jgi:GNAT superfamily N-acetyltransferase